MINGGSNNLAKNFGKGRSSLVTLLQYAQNYVNTNVLMVHIPTRYDLPTTSQLNHEIKNFSGKFCKRIQLFQHVHLTEMTTDRKHFTKHGFHLNIIGKEGLAREIALQITEIIKPTLNNNKPMLPLPWNEEPVIHSFIYSHSIDHTDVEFVIKYKYKLLTIYKYKLQIEKSMSAWNSCSKPFRTDIYKEQV